MHYISFYWWYPIQDLTPSGREAKGLKVPCVITIPSKLFFFPDTAVSPFRFFRKFICDLSQSSRLETILPQLPQKFRIFGMKLAVTPP
jgi:hypothetical protein